MSGVTLKQTQVICNLRWPTRAWVLGALLTLLSGAAPAAPDIPTPAMDGYEVEIHKSRNELLIRNGTGVVRRYHAAFGAGGGGTKQRQGDGVTPVGSYRIVDFKEDSRFQFFMLLNYPNLVDGWKGYRDQTIDAAQFKAIATAWRNGVVPPQDTPLGGYIGIHGIGEVTPKKLEIHRSQNWTKGCIALSNEEIEELRRYVTVGTRVTIRE